jgi:hypothetical protein
MPTSTILLRINYFFDHLDFKHASILLFLFNVDESRKVCLFYSLTCEVSSVFLNVYVGALLHLLPNINIRAPALINPKRPAGEIQPWDDTTL